MPAISVTDLRVATLLLIVALAFGVLAAAANRKPSRKGSSAGEVKQTPGKAQAPVKEQSTPAVTPSQSELSAAEGQRETPPIRDEASQTEEILRSAEAPAPTDSALTQQQSAGSENGQAMKNEQTSKASTSEARETTGAANLRLTPPLSQLRGMPFSTRIKELDRAKRSAQHNAVAEALLKQIEPFEPLIESTCGVKQGARPSQELMPTANSSAASEAETAQAAKTNTGTREAGSGESGAESSEPSKATAKSKGDDGGRGGFEEVQILPSKRGQYRKKS